MAKYFRKELLYAFAILFGPLNFGFSIGFPSPAQINWRDQNWEAAQKSPEVWENLVSWFNSITSLCAIFAPFITAPLLKFFGRKVLFFGIQIIIAISWIVLLFMSKEHFWVGIFARAIQGLAIGGFSHVCPLMLIEISPRDTTGFYGNINQAGIVLGIMIMELQGEKFNWDTLCYTGIVTSVIGAITVWFVPETSPLPKYRKTNSFENDNEDIDHHKYVPTLCSGHYLMMLIIGVTMMLIQQFAGVNAIHTNQAEDFEAAGIPMASNYAAAMTTAAQLVGLIVSSIIIDKVGRRPIFCVSCIGCGLCLFLYAGNLVGNWWSLFPIFLIFIYMFFFGGALGPIPWFYIPEIFPDVIRSDAAAIISMVNWLGSFIIIFISKRMSLFPVGWMQGIFGVIASLGSIFGYFFIMEPSSFTLNSAVYDYNEEDE